MAYEAYQKITGIIQDVRSGGSCCNQIVSVMTENGQISLSVTGETRIVGNTRLRRGMRIAGFYDASLPAPAIYPPQYQAELITPLRKGQEVTLNYFDENLMAEDGSLQLNIGPMANIETLNGQRYLCHPGNAELLVYYTSTTFSLPPQTTPQKIIVMCSY